MAKLKNSKKVISVKVERMIFFGRRETIIIRRGPRGASGVLARIYLLTQVVIIRPFGF